MEPLISVIIPVYNVEQYLDQCVDSILNQTYSNLEIILVDDGSTDCSGQLCDGYKDKRVKVIHKENGGLSDARNKGIDVAQGEYISFVDSDDFVSADFISSLYGYVKQNNIDISACGFCHFFDSGKQKKINFDGIKKKYIGESAQIYLNVVGYFNVSACNKLFHKRLFETIRFPVGKKSEDWYVMHLLIDAAGGIYYDSEVKYFYRQREGSITKSVDINYDSVYAASNVFQYYIENQMNNAIVYAAQALAFAYIGIYNIYLCKVYDLEKMREIRKEVLKLKDNITYKEISMMRKFQLFLFLHYRTLYNLCFSIFNLKRKLAYK